ncbi:MAG: tRNA (N(6)-L-threonylcarbamoyladenosine(37)-C(2))-methylthiotransferase MtaB [Kosmotoga sp.]|nr:MAG: tRNA (N(6)-L-threonylcarbamoyladenosine(37)-C(2))-methylthiotransferase MtaB [Kosmotoga sp.]
MNKRVSIFTYGCKLNQYETEIMRERLSQKYNVSLEGEQADLFIINTCTVTAEAERKTRQLIRRLKRENRKASFVAVGCYSKLSPDDFKYMDFDYVGGIEEKSSIDKIVDAILNNDEPVTKNVEHAVAKKGPADRTRAYLAIQDGCINNCAYCRIRLARGSKIKSKDRDLVLEEFRQFIIDGYREIVLTGVNIGYYGFDRNDSLLGLLKYLSTVQGDWRLRLSSIDPRTMMDELIDYITNHENIAQHIHLSLQSGSNSVLKRMRRNYTVESYESIVNKLRSKNERFSFTTDIIVGFPGETENEFKETCLFVKKMGFLKTHIFRFSPRPGTEAYTMKNEISGTIKKNRARLLREIAKESSENYLEAQVGKESTVLVENTVNNNSIGYDEYYIQHIVNGIHTEGFVRVKIQKTERSGAFSNAELCCESMEI